MHIAPITWLKALLGLIRSWFWQKVRARAGGDLARADALQTELDDLRVCYQGVVKREAGLADSVPHNFLGRSQLRSELGILASCHGATDGLIRAIRQCEAVIEAPRGERALAFGELAAEYRAVVQTLKAEMTSLRGGMSMGPSR